MLSTLAKPHPVSQHPVTEQDFINAAETFSWGEYDYVTGAWTNGHDSQILNEECHRLHVHALRIARDYTVSKPDVSLFRAKMRLPTMARSPPDVERAYISYQVKRCELDMSFFRLVEDVRAAKQEDNVEPFFLETTKYLVLMIDSKLALLAACKREAEKRKIESALAVEADSKNEA